MAKMVPDIVYYVVPSIVVLYAYRKYRESKWGWCTNKVKLDGKVAVVTGANCGIGYEVAAGLLERGATVVFACRSIEKASLAVLQIDRQNPHLVNVKKFFIELDLGSIESIQKFAKELTEVFPKIDILVNNAGVAYPDDQRLVTKHGFEIHFGINHLGHFLLTNLLLKNLERNPDDEPSRVIVVTSRVHEKAIIDLQNLNLEKQSDGKKGYANSKLANIYFARELARKTKDKGIRVYSVCPGWVFTSLFRHYKSKILKYIIAIIPAAYLFMRSPKQGAQTILYCATSPHLTKQTGECYVDCKKYTSKHEFNDIVGERLWKESENMLDKVYNKI